MGNFKTKLSKASDALLNIKTFAFFVPFLIILIAFAFLQVYPFGSKTVLTVDLYHQYMPFLYEVRAKILGGRSLFYSWDSGLGTEFYAAFTNYCSSPLNLLSLLFSYKALPVFVAFVTAIRAGLASLFMTMFLSSNDNRRYDMVTAAFGMTYALSGWFLTDFWNIMWCDAFVLLPLVCLGLRKLLLEGKYGLYVSSLAICIISNFYAGFFICLFLSFFSIVMYFTVNRRENIRVKTFFVSAGRFVLGSITAGAISAITALPTYLILQHSSAMGDEFPKDFTLTGNLFDFLGRLMSTANPNIRDGMANVFCGIVVVLMIPLFFMANKSDKITLRHKIGYGLTLFILYLSFSNRMLNYIWHGFHFPNQIPYRQSFIMSFVLVTMAFITIRCLKSFEKRTLSGVIIGAIAFLILYEKFGAGNEGYQQIGLSLLFVVVQGMVLHHIISVSGAKKRNACQFLLLCTMVFEILVSSVFTISRVSEHEGFTSYDFYGKNREAVHNYVVNVEGTDGHNTFERTEMYPNNICEIQAVYDVKGMSIFSSTARESLVKYMRNFGFHNNGINGLRNAGLTRVTASLLGVRNFACLEYTQTVPNIFDTEYSDGEVTVLGNPDALSVGYMVSDDILTYEPVYEIPDAFYKTNDLVRYMGIDSDVYTPIVITPELEQNVSGYGTAGAERHYNIISADQQTVLKYTVTDAEIGSDVYIYMDCSKGGRVTVESNSINQNYEIRSYSVITVGKFTGEPITVTFTYDTAPTGVIHMYSYQLNRPGYDRMIQELSDEQLLVTSYDDTSIRGMINVNKEGFMLLTIPYSDGFKLKVDGQETELVPVQDALCGVHLTAGSHTIELQYVPEGFVLSSMVTVAGIVMLIAEIAIPMFISKRKKTAAVVAEVEVTEEPVETVEDTENAVAPAEEEEVADSENE